MSTKGFQHVTPESVGIPSEAVNKFLHRLENVGLYMHSVLMLKDGKLICEGYYDPYGPEDLHRMYSVSKSFTSMAIGYLIGEGKLSLDSKLMEFFPEYDTPDLHPYIKRTTIRDLLMMADSHSTPSYKGDVDTDWVDVYFKHEPSHLPGTIYAYNTASTVMLCVIVEKITGKTFLELLKEKVLLETGFSPNSTCVETPCGHAWGGSGVLCTPMDLMRFAYLCMKGGNWFGKQLLPEDYVREATSKQIDNYMDNTDSDHQQGYGYQFWRIKNNGFGCFGMGSQFAFCLPDKDFILVVTGDNQALNPNANIEILRGLWDDLYPQLDQAPLHENAEAFHALQEHIGNLKLNCLKGRCCAPAAERISGKTFVLNENEMGIRNITLTFNDDEGVMEYENRTGKHSLSFGMCKNVQQEFPETHYSGIRIGTPYGKGYRCFTSACWIGDEDLLLNCLIADMYFGSFKMQISFRGDEVSLRMWKIAEWFLQDYQGWAGGRLAE